MATRSEWQGSVKGRTDHTKRNRAIWGWARGGTPAQAAGADPRSRAWGAGALALTFAAAVLARPCAAPFRKMHMMTTSKRLRTRTLATCSTPARGVGTRVKRQSSFLRKWFWAPAYAAGLLLLSIDTAAAQQSITYDASLGTFPTRQCFEWSGGMLGVNHFILEVAGGALHQSTIGPPTGGPSDPDPYGLFWYRTDVAFNFADGFAMEMIALPVSVGENLVAGVMRTGLYFNAVDDAGRWIVVWFRDGGISLANHIHAPLIGAVVSAAAPTDGAYHVYRVRADGGGVHLDIDDVNVLNLPLGATNQATRIVLFGDGTSWQGANSEVYIRSFQFSGCLTDFNCDGVVDSNDYFAFLDAFFEDSGAADLNGDGAVTSDDYFSFLTAFFEGC